MGRSADLFEEGLKELLAGLLRDMPNEAARDRIKSVEQEMGQDGAGFQQFSLRQLIDLYRDAAVFDELRIPLTSNLQKTKEIDWAQVSAWDEERRAEAGDSVLDKSAATLMCYWLKIFIYDCELVRTEEEVAETSQPQHSWKECPECGEPLSHDENFCPNCGLLLKSKCGACGRQLEPEFRICPFCETPVRSRGEADSDDRAKKHEYRVLCMGVYSDGVVNTHERRFLDQKRLELGLSAGEADSIERTCDKFHTLEYMNFVEGVLIDGIIDDDERVFLDGKAEALQINPRIARQIEETAVELRNEQHGVGTVRAAR